MIGTVLSTDTDGDTGGHCNFTTICTEDDVDLFLLAKIVHVDTFRFAIANVYPCTFKISLC